MSERGQAPRIVGFSADLMTTTKIESAATRLGYEVTWIERAGQLSGPPAETGRIRQPAEHLTGSGAGLVDLLSEAQPALILFDLGNAAIPWQEWLALITSAPATRRFPVVCFGSHVDVGALVKAQELGAQAALARSRFLGDIPGMLAKYARRPDPQAIQAACQMPLSALAVRGIQEFNRGEYFEAHESLEAAWNEDETPGRELYRAILQVAVAYLQIERGNYRGAVKMFLRVRQWIDPLPDVCRGVEVARLRAEARQVHAALLAVGEDGIGSLDRSLLKPVVYTPNPS